MTTRKRTPAYMFGQLLAIGLGVLVGMLIVWGIVSVGRALFSA